MPKEAVVIAAARSFDARYQLPTGAGSDAVHSNPEYCLAVTLLETKAGLTGCGIVLTLGEGNRIVCELIDALATALVGREIEELMASFGQVSRRLADHPHLRWLGPHKGAVHLALASITNACFDLWAKARGVPLWRLLLDFTPEQAVRLLDVTYLDDVLVEDACLDLLRQEEASRNERSPLLKSGYPGYDTSVGWFEYDDDRVREGALRALDAGFRAFKLKVGSRDSQRDLRRAHLLRELVGPHGLVMLDANQQWALPQAVQICQALRSISPYWIEEPTHPDDVGAHRKLREAIAPIRIALGEHVPNRVMFKNFMEAGALDFVQVDCTRVAGVSEFLTVSLLARKFGLPVVPHVGDMGQIHQHLVLFNHIALGHPVVFLEYIPHLRPHFVNPARVESGVYRVPQEPGSSCDLVELRKP
ncbi:MAG TPA: enolase C-terminal domain-like protein [Terriglobia bacterium]|nr:enolase C-terminal domain-like protein [Terriglobia bacterium]